ncbi:SMC-Scp complex subunit ScpB [Pseudomonas saliphila]|uniref:SMC-Scp complex subunit ScpB n=1 Tax=Pseudomonas saliphila TaxID=2586906 RepID=UPI00123B8A01|nr:SMC-Scp complex subunit ScpB [Pseudomonas saliphila]
MKQPPLEHILEAAMLAAGKPLSLDRMRELFDESARPSVRQLQNALARLQEQYLGRAIELKEVASGWRLQVREEYSPWVSRLWEERPQRYSRALLETLSLIAYRQPITRGEIEDIRGVAVSSQIVKTLMEREWVRIVGHRDVPGRPAMYATTRQFLDHFNLTSLSELPALAELRDLDQIEAGLPSVEASSAASDEQTPWLPVEPLRPLDGAAGETGFHALLDELNSMESNIKTDFSDLHVDSSDEDGTGSDGTGRP